MVSIQSVEFYSRLNYSNSIDKGGQIEIFIIDNKLNNINEIDSSLWYLITI